MFNIINLRKTVSRAIRYRDDPEGNVINLSKYSFTKKQFKVSSIKQKLKLLSNCRALQQGKNLKLA